MSELPLRVSDQVTIAPAAPSEMIAGSPGLPADAQRTAPSTGHAESTTPSASTCSAYMPLSTPLRPSAQATMAPPEPSGTITGDPWSFAAVHRGKLIAGSLGQAAKVSAGTSAENTWT